MSATVPKQTIHFLGYDGLDIVADAFGDRSNPPVLFAHGGGQTRHAWGGAAEALGAAGFYAVTMDLRGHGDSAWCPDGNYAMEAYARDLVEVTATFKQQPSIVGASLGGLAGMIVEGASAPGTFRSLTMVDITPRMEQAGVDQIMGFMAEKMVEGFASLDEAAEVIADYMPHRKRTKNLDGLAKNLRLHDDGRYRWHWDPAFVTISTRARGNREDGFLDKVAEGVKCPTHLIRGKQSQIVSEEAVKHFFEVIPHAEYTDISDAGHMIAGDKNDVFKEAVIGFLEKLK